MIPEAFEHRALLEREQIRTDFTIVEEPVYHNCLVQGGNYPNCGRAYISMWPGLKKADKKAYDFVLVRQFYHLKKCSDFRKKLYLRVSSLAVFIFVLITTKSLLIAIPAFMICHVGLDIYFDERFSKKADEFAVKNASDDELKGGFRFLKALQKLIYTNSKVLKVSEQTALTYSNGEQFLYPWSSLKKRVELIRQEGVIRHLEFLEDETLERKILNVLQAQINPKEFKFLKIC